MSMDLTYGQKAVGLTFNPGGLESVNKIKRQFADIIDELHNRKIALAGPCEEGRLLSIAITEAQTAQMWAVKAITWSL